MIATRWPAGLPVLELFARVDAEHPLPEGWGAWGNQSGAEPQAPADEVDSNLAVVSPSGEMAAAADATSDRASAAAAVEGAPYDAGDVVTIDQLAGSEWLSPNGVRAAELSEREQLKILSDFCHPQRALQNAIGPLYVEQGYAYQSSGQWALRGAGWDRLRELEAAAAPPAPANPI
jgi:hypothetical protein